MSEGGNGENTSVIALVLSKAPVDNKVVSLKFEIGIFLFHRKRIHPGNFYNIFFSISIFTNTGKPTFFWKVVTGNFQIHDRKT